MAISANGQDELNPALQLASWADKIVLSRTVEITGTCCVPQENSIPIPHKSFIDQACLLKIAEYLPSYFFAWL